jgi:hypothetical protein
MPKKTKVQLIVYETGWILEAIAKQWKEKIDRIPGFSCDISHGTIAHADIYIHLVYTKAKLVSRARNIVYVTHINFSSKIKYIYRGVKNKAEFVTMSNMTTDYIKRIFPFSMVYTILPESIHFLKKDYHKHLTLGLFFRIYDDNRKNNQAIQQLFEVAEKRAGKLRLIVYGQGFEKFISKSNSPFVIYDKSNFKKKTYETYLKECDYVVNYAFDEGAISILDAATLNVPVLTSKQGYHLDINLPVGSFLFSKADEINEKIQEILDYSFHHEDNDSMDRTLAMILKSPERKDSKPAFIIFLYYCVARFRFNPIREKNDLYNSLNKIFRFDKLLKFLNLSKFF